MLGGCLLLFKVFNGTDGRVTPKDLNIMLSNYGSASKNLSDDGIYTFGSTISVEKQNAGE